MQYYNQPNKLYKKLQILEVNMECYLQLKRRLKSNKIVYGFYLELRVKFRLFLYRLSPKLLALYSFFVIHHRIPNYKNPRVFDEKLQWLMLFWGHPLKVKCADKYSVRSYIESLGLGYILPELIAVYNNSREIDFRSLPDRFVLKCTHGCGFNIICKDKKHLNIEDTIRKLDYWMKKDISRINGEIHYAKITPRIICEKYIDDLSGNLPIDYKIYCFDGKAHCTMVCKDRENRLYANFYFYDREWKKILPYNKTSLFSQDSIPKPPRYKDMLSIAEKLSNPFPFVRIDLYSIDGNILFGEMTFTPNGCVDKGYTEFAEKELGGLINLPEKLMK